MSTKHHLKLDSEKVLQYRKKLYIQIDFEVKRQICGKEGGKKWGSRGCVKGPREG